jgi:hypothetical protein
VTLSVRNTLQDRNLLLTGATGFLGKVVAAHLLEEVPGVRLGWVVRGDPAAQAVRLATLFSTSPAFRALRERHGEDWPRWISERVQAIAGNLGEDQLGVEDHVLRGYDAVLNIGGLVDFDPDPVEAFQTNVEGARNAARAAAHTQHRVLIHVSTCFVVGTREGEVDEIVSDSDPTGRPWDVAATVERLRGLLVEVSDPRARRDIVRALARERGVPQRLHLLEGPGRAPRERGTHGPDRGGAARGRRVRGLVAVPGLERRRDDDGPPGLAPRDPVSGLPGPPRRAV